MYRGTPRRDEGQTQVTQLLVQASYKLMISITNIKRKDPREGRKTHFTFNVEIQAGDGVIWHSGWKYYPESGAVQGPAWRGPQGWIPSGGAKGDGLKLIVEAARHTITAQLIAQNLDVEPPTTEEIIEAVVQLRRQRRET